MKPVISSLILFIVCFGHWLPSAFAGDRGQNLPPQPIEAHEREGPLERITSNATPAQYDYVQFAIQRTKFGFFPEDSHGVGATATKFASDYSQADDLQALGASIIRYDEKRDFTWSNLTAHMGNDVPVPVSGGAVKNYIKHATNVEIWKEFFKKLHARGIKIILHCMPWEDRDDDGFARNPPSDYWGVLEAIKLTWSENLAAYVTDPNRELLDIRNPVEQQYLGYMASGMAELLGLIQNEINFPLEDVIFSIQPFNRIDDRNVMYRFDSYENVYDNDIHARRMGSASESAKYWAETYARVASRLKKGLVSANLDIPIILPGISEYLENKGRNSLAYKFEFLEEFLAKLPAELSAQPSAYRYAMSEVAKGISWTWYHRNASGARPYKDAEQFLVDDHGFYKLGPLHIASLVAELKHLRGILDGVGLTGSTIVVTEMGISVTDGDEQVPVFDVNRTQLQAHEVWRRLTAAAIGAQVVGWDGWMSRYPSDSDMVVEYHKEYYGMGLRDDDQEAMDSPSTATQRSSWHAYKRLTEIFSMITGGELLHPGIPSSISSSDPSGYTPIMKSNYLVIIQLNKPVSPTGKYLYVLFVDSSYSGAGNLSYNLRASWKSTQGTCKLVDTSPNMFTANTFFDGMLPTNAAGYLSDVDCDFATGLSVTGGEMPLLIRSSDPLSFTRLATPALATPALTAPELATQALTAPIPTLTTPVLTVPIPTLTTPVLIVPTPTLTAPAQQ